MGDCDFGDAKAFCWGGWLRPDCRCRSRIISADMVERGKPDPEPYRRGAELLGFPAGGLRGGGGCSFGVLGLASRLAAACWGVLGTHSLDELREASWVMSSLEGLVVTANVDGLELRFAPVACPVV